MEQDRRKQWDGRERRGCYFDPETAAHQIAIYLAEDRKERREQETNERYERIGRKTVKGFLFFGGALGLYLIGRGHEALMGFFTWVLKLAA